MFVMLILHLFMKSCEDILMSDDSNVMHVLFCRCGCELGVGTGCYCGERVGLMPLIIVRVELAIFLLCSILLNPIKKVNLWLKKALV